MYSAVK